MRGSAAAILCLTVSVFAQEPKLTFEVASVKPSTVTDNGSSINNKPGGQLSCQNVNLRQLIAFAYDIRDYQILNAPGWAGTDRYDVMAKPSAEDMANEPQGRPTYLGPAAERLQRRTRALLAERFGLVVREEKKEMSVYALVVGSGGHKLADTKAEIGPSMSWSNTKVACKKVTMKRFAEVLIASQFNRFVVDQTGLTGEYDFEMKFVPDPSPTKAGEPTPAVNESAGPSFESALQEQLGLKLITTKAPVTFWAIDKAERLTAN